jgi:hypothetical protein
MIQKLNVVAGVCIVLSACSVMGQTNGRSAKVLSPDLGNIYYRDPATVTAVAALADKVPLLNVNLNNYKDHSNPILRGTPGEWDERGIGRVVIYHAGGQDWRMWYAGFCMKG